MVSQLQNDVYNWLYGLGQKTDEAVKYYGGPHLFQGLQNISSIAQTLLPGSGFVEAADAAKEGDVGGVGLGLLGEVPGGDLAKAIFLAPKLAKQLDPVFPHRLEFDKSTTGKAIEADPQGWENYIKALDPESSKAERVFLDSGYFQDKQGNVLREIPDLGMGLKPVRQDVTDDLFTITHPAGDVHSLLGIPPVEVNRFMQPGSGQFNKATGQILVGGQPSDIVTGLNPTQVGQVPYDILWALDHELNHAAQRASKIEGGFSPTLSIYHPRLWEDLNVEPNVNFADTLIKNYNKGKVDDPAVSAALDLYRKMYGEQMAENSAMRMMHSELLLRHPGTTLPYPEDVLFLKDTNRNIFK